TLGLTVRLRGLLLKRKVLDRPNARSSHSQPTPRGGGWALVIVLVLGMIAAAALQGAAGQTGLITGTLLLALISWLDDRGGVNAGIRLAAHIAAAFLGSLALHSDLMIFGGALPFVLDRTLMILGWAWFMNLYNFMDGIDGITSAETVAI